MTLEKAIEFGKIFLKSIENEKGSATYEFVETAVKALKKLERIKQIINDPIYIREDVFMYKMIKEIVESEDKE